MHLQSSRGVISEGGTYFLSSAGMDSQKEHARRILGPNRVSEGDRQGGGDQNLLGVGLEEGEGKKVAG